jgi:hypothetical protein
MQVQASASAPGRRSTDRPPTRGPEAFFCWLVLDGLPVVALGGWSLVRASAST